MRNVVVDASAKVNVGWRVGERRDDGYHDVAGLVQTITLRDRIEVSPVEGADRLVTVSVSGHPELESNDNLVVRAAECIAVVLKHEPTPVRIRIDKSIPVASGLGGGSADAAGALLAVSMLWKAKLSSGDLVRMGAEVGSDVPAILRGGLVHASGRGEQVRNVGSFTLGSLVLGVTSDGISAADAYRAFDGPGDRVERAADLPSLHHNDLEQAACQLQPPLAARLDVMRQAAGVAFVSGSGPTVVGVTRSPDEADAVRARVATHFDEVLIAQPCTWGVRMHLGGS